MFVRAVTLFAAVSSAFAGTTLRGDRGERRIQMEPSVKTFSSSSWLREDNVKPTETISAVFALKHDRDQLKSFESRMLEISTPGNADYGKWLSVETIQSMISPDNTSVAAVTDYLISYGVKTFKVNQFRDLIQVTMPVDVASKMLDTEFARFRSVIRRDISIIRITKPYSLPASVAAHVSIVDDILRFPSVRKSILSQGAEEMTPLSGDPFASCGNSCNGYTTPDVLQARYGYPDVSTVSPLSSMSVAEFQYQYYDQTDIDAFDSACDVNAQVDAVVGGNNPKVCDMGGCVEALLDIEYIGAIAAPIPLTVYYSSQYSLLDWVNGIMAMSPLVWVHSVSYGNDEVQQTSAEYMETCNTQFMLAGSMGISILFASGDQGVWGRSGVGRTYHPDFPAGSPYVTAVGGTNFQTKSVIGEESAWSCGGGGFSDEFAQPSWQADAVANYFAEATAQGLLPSASLFNANGRGYPDVSALGGQTNPYCISYKDGTFAGVAGTSASCPVVAGIFAQLNNVRFNAGKSSLGWLNPLIYANGQCFNDVNDKSSNFCNAGTQGFAALDGWDPATGMGTPIYSCLETVASAV